MTLLKIYILIVYTHVNGGATVSFQEFNSYEQCTKNAKFLYTKSGIYQAYCTEK